MRGGFSESLLERCKRAAAAPIGVVAARYLLGVDPRMDKRVQSLGVTSLSRSQVARMVADLDAQVTAFAPAPWTTRPVHVRRRRVDDEGPRGRPVINAVVLVATGVNGDEHREDLGCRVTTSETRKAWNAFLVD